MSATATFNSTTREVLERATAATTITFAVAILVLVVRIAHTHIRGKKSNVYLTLAIDILFCCAMIVSSTLLLVGTYQEEGPVCLVQS